MKNKSLMKISLLSPALIVAAGPAINPNIPALVEHFSEFPIALVEMIATIPSLFLMISLLLSPFIAEKIGYKQTMLSGLSLAAVSGIAPLFIENLYLVLLSRAVLGFGIGLFNSLLTYMISHFYDGNERRTTIGLQQAVTGLGGMLLVFIAGRFVHINWQMPFVAYFLILIPLFLFWRFVPNIPKNSESIKIKAVEKTTSFKLPKIIFVFLQWSLSQLHFI